MSQTKFSPRRKQYLITAYVMAGWSSICAIIVFSGLLAEMEADETATIVIGYAIVLLMMIPSIIGTAMAMSAMRKGANTVGIWIALGWNATILALVALLMVLGSLAE